MKDLQRKNTDLKNQNEITEEVNRDMSEELTNLKQILEHERRLRNRFSKTIQNNFDAEITGILIINAKEKGGRRSKNSKITIARNQEKVN